MTTSSGRRRPTKLSPEKKWEIFLAVTAGDITQADAARKHAVDVSTVIGIRRTVKDAALAALARKPGRPASERNWELEAARAEIAQLTEAIKSQAIELAVVSSPGKIGLGLNGPVPARVPAEVKELVLKTVDDAVAAGFSHRWACSLWQVSDDRVHRWRARRRDVGTLEDLAPGGTAVHALLPAEVDAIMAIAEQWGPVDRSHRKLAHRGSYVGQVWVSPSTFRRVLAAQGLVLPQLPAMPRRDKTPWPDWLVWEPNRIWIWDVTHFSRSRRCVFAVIDMVSRYWIATLVSPEETSTQVRVVFDQALVDQGLDELLTDDRLDLDTDDPARPILLAVSDNGPAMTSVDTRAYMAMMAIAQHHGRPHTPTDQAWIETFFGHIKHEWPHLLDITDPALLETELDRIRIDYNTVRLHEAIGYVTPHDEHHGQGEAISEARRQGLTRARQTRLEHNRRTTTNKPEETP